MSGKSRPLPATTTALLLQDIPQVCKQLEEGRQKDMKAEEWPWGRTVEEDLVFLGEGGWEVVRKGSWE